MTRHRPPRDLRREINDGLNVVECWNDTNDFIFFGKGSEFATNRQEDQERGIHCLHLLQSSLVYINTLRNQRILRGPAWTEWMTVPDLAALSPLPTKHVNPFGRFDLDLETRIPLGDIA